MVTGGPSNVAIFVGARSVFEARSVSGEAGALVCPDAARAASFAGGAASPVAAILVSSAGTGASARADAASVFAGLSETGISGLAGSGGDESSGFSAAIFSGSAGVERGAACSAAAKGKAAGGISGDFAPTGASMRSTARTGRVPSGLAASGLAASGLGASRLGASVCCANIVSGVACHDGLLANSSCAARSRAAAPSPKIKSTVRA